jgi:hypothetical protein
VGAADGAAGGSVGERLGVSECVGVGEGVGVSTGVGVGVGVSTGVGVGVGVSGGEGVAGGKMGRLPYTATTLLASAEATAEESPPNSFKGHVTTLGGG